jgi:hypothetical protein
LSGKQHKLVVQGQGSLYVSLDAFQTWLPNHFVVALQQTPQEAPRNNAVELSM